MTDPTSPTAARRKGGLRSLLLPLGLFAAAACALAVARSSWAREALEALFAPRPRPSGMAKPPDVAFEAPGIRQPPAFPAAEAALDEDTRVIGVSSGGRVRAYVVDAFAQGPQFHIVNDVLGGLPVSVTYCDISGCARVFTGDKPDTPLDLAQGGLKGYRLLLKAGGHAYRQESAAPLERGAPAFPYQPHPHELTTWGAWRQSHPDTDVYVGP